MPFEEKYKCKVPNRLEMLNMRLYLIHLVEIGKQHLNVANTHMLLLNIFDIYETSTDVVKNVKIPAIILKHT